MRGRARRVSGLVPSNACATLTFTWFFAIAGSLGSVRTASADNFQWVGGSDSWTRQLSNWQDLSLSGSDKTATHLPGLADDVTINAGNVSLTSSGSANLLYLSSSLSIFTGSYLSTGSTEVIGWTSLGNIVQFGGTNAPAVLSVRNGSYSLSGGILSSPAEWLSPPTQVGVTNIAEFTQSGGTNTAGYLTLSPTSKYTMNAGNLNVNTSGYGYTQVAGNFIQSGGTHSIAASASAGVNFMVGSGGNYSLSGGSLSASAESIGWNSGSGTFAQTGGTNTASDTYTALVIGASSGTTGTYNLSGTGSLIVTSSEYVGSSGTGIFNQSGGNHQIGTALRAGYSNLTIGDGAGGVGTYNLSGSGSLVVNGNEYIGYSGTGTFTQTGGTHTVTNGSVTLGGNGGTGTYNLQGGSLNVKGLVMSSGGTFNLRGAAPSTSLSVENLSNSGTMSIGGNSVVSGGTAPVQAAAFWQYSTGTLNVQIGGTGNGQFGQLVAGNATLAGKLSVTLVNGFQPDYVHSYKILQTTSRSGTFNNGSPLIQVGPGPYGPPRFFKVIYANDGVTIQPTTVIT